MIKIVVLPLLNENEKRLIINIYKSLDLNETADLIENIGLYLDDKTKILFVEEKKDKQEKDKKKKKIFLIIK